MWQRPPVPHLVYSIAEETLLNLTEPNTVQYESWADINPSPAPVGRTGYKFGYIYPMFQKYKNEMVPIQNSDVITRVFGVCVCH